MYVLNVWGKRKKNQLSHPATPTSPSKFAVTCLVYLKNKHCHQDCPWLAVYHSPAPAARPAQEILALLALHASNMSNHHVLT